MLQEFTSYTNFDECLDYIEDIIIKQGPFDGLLGFSQVCSVWLPLPRIGGIPLCSISFLSQFGYFLFVQIEEKKC